MNSVLEVIRQNLEEQRFETARRMCLDAISGASDDSLIPDIKLLLHEALVKLGDIKGAHSALESFQPRNRSEHIDLLLLLAEDFHKLSAYDFFRDSPERDQGLTGDEYADKYESMADEKFNAAVEMVDTESEKQRVAAAMRRASRSGRADVLAEPPAPEAALPVIPAGRGSIFGKLTFPDGTPVRNAKVTLGFPFDVSFADPRGYLGRGIGGGMEIHFKGEQETREVKTDNSGAYRFADIPSQIYPFLALTLDPFEYDLSLLFFARDIDVPLGGEVCRDRVVREWVSAPAEDVENPFPEQRILDGTNWTRVLMHTLGNPFYFDFPKQFVEFSMQGALRDEQLILFTSDAPDMPKPVQKLISGNVGCFLDLPERSSRIAALYACESGKGEISFEQCRQSGLSFKPEQDSSTAIVDTGRAMFKIPAGEGEDDSAPLLSVRGEDDVWRGEGRLVLPENIQVKKRITEVVERGALLIRITVSYLLSTEETATFELTAHDDEPYLLVRETSVPIDGFAFEFSLKEFSGGRGFLHWTPEHGGKHWSTLNSENRELARLQESVAWWIPPQGFGYAMTMDNLASRDYIGVFTRRRGEWIDRDFEKIAQGPGDENRELDWPFPEMVGSTISMITAHTSKDGDAYFRFAGFDGERQWSILVSTLERNDGPYKELSSVQHKVSSPRLQDFMHWRLHEPDSLQRPLLLLERSELRGLRRKTHNKTFAPVWDKLVKGHKRGPSRGLQAVLNSDPVQVWKLACEMRAEAPLRSRMTLLGRDYSDVYSPVGGRGITPFAEQYDLIAPTGVFSAEEERDVRSMLLLMGHMFMEEDFMNWRFNSRNANFEADRVDIVGTVGLAFRGNPDAEEMISHALGLMERSLEVYCTPGSGKWYENPACYYLHAASCRLNLAFHLWKHNLLDVSEIPRLKDFLRWGPLLLTAPYPHDYTILRDGCTFEEYEQAEKVRRIPPIGDHAKLGQWVSEFFALMGKTFKDSDPDFAEFLRWAYQEGGSDGGHFSKFPLFFTAIEEDLTPAKPQILESRRLEGFGSVFRGAFGTPDEFYLLFKQGPGGYRYHRTEGSFLLMAHGRPLVWDGGEAGETWRHSTLSFHETHMPLAPGHVERFHSFTGIDFVQGVHPKALSPGEPVFLSDSCEHTLVDLAYERFAEPNPAVIRSVTWVKSEYIIVGDDLDLPEGTQTHWHLQAVGDSHEGSIVEDGAMRLHGRYGIDLQLLIPDIPGDAQEMVEQVATLEYNIPAEKSFSMRHVRLSMCSPKRLTALLQPLLPGAKPLSATVENSILRVKGEGIDDVHFFYRTTTEKAYENIEFSGRYGAVLKRKKYTKLILFDGEYIRYNDHVLKTAGEQCFTG
jgi:hypothetical protein